MAIPLMVLYEISIIGAKLMIRKKAPSEAAEKKRSECKCITWVEMPLTCGRSLVKNQAD